MKIKEIFPDETLADLIAQHLKVSISCVVSKEQLSSINSLLSPSKSNQKIASLEGLQHLTNLKSLVFDNNAIEDLTPISNLKKLEMLNLENNLISEISLLSNLTKIYYLNLSNNCIKEIPKYYSRNLQHLHFSNTKIKNLEHLKNFRNLETLVINSDSDLKTLPLLTKVDFLAISKKSYDKAYNSKLKVLSNSQKLNAFLSYDDKIKDYSFIQNLPNLKLFQFPKDDEIVTVSYKSH